jgi:hypothetical protein
MKFKVGDLVIVYDSYTDYRGPARVYAVNEDGYHCETPSGGHRLISFQGNDTIAYDDAAVLKRR